MSQDSEIRIDHDRLMSLVPIGSLLPQTFSAVASSMITQRIEPGTRLFAQGDSDHDTVFVLEGEVELTASDGGRNTVVGGTDGARYPIASLKPRRYTAVTKSPVTLLRVESALLDRTVGQEQVIRNQLDGYEVQELGGRSSASLSQLLRNELLRRLPVSSLQALFIGADRISVKAGETVIRQGDQGDFFYIVVEGSCLVTRRSSDAGNTAKLAVLHEGEFFGDEALILDQPRNANVSMLSDGVLLRIKREDFRTLMTEPMVKRVTPKQAAGLVRDGARLIDVRLESEFRQATLKGAANVPLYLLRRQAPRLKANCPYVVFCDTGSRSAAAAFLLSGIGYDVSMIDGGVARYLKSLDDKRKNG